MPPIIQLESLTKYLIRIENKRETEHHLDNQNTFSLARLGVKENSDWTLELG